MKPSMLSLLVLGACAPSAPPEVRSSVARDTAPAVADADYQSVIDGNTQFALDLYDSIRPSAGNLFFSPYSISQALGMTYAGANGETATQMQSTLRIPSDASTFHGAMDRLDLDLASRAAHATSKARAFALHSSDLLWAQKGKQFESPFLDTLAADYDAGVYVLDFAHDPGGSRDTINGWVAHETDDKIEALLPPDAITSDTTFVLTNAIYFTAAWQTPFDANDTAPADFTLDSGEVVQATTMSQTDTRSMSYAQADDFEAMELGYDGGDLALLVLLPASNAPGALDALEAELTRDKLAQVVSQLAPSPYGITLPKVKFDAKLGLRDTLADLGMTDAFDAAAADFSAMDGARDILLADVIHQGFVDIDEQGTTAAAATAVAGAGAAAPPQFVRVDHPYLILIRDRPTGTILFMGRVLDPR